MAKRKRGPEPKPAEQIRKTRVSVYFTVIELAELDARRGGYERSEWLRRAGLGRRLAAPIPAINREAKIELSRIARNLNQVTKSMNAAGQIRDAELVGILAELNAQVSRLRGDLVAQGRHLVDGQVVGDE